MLEPDIRQDWLDALRSGEYTKADGRLREHAHNAEAFCAWGVLMDIHPDVQWVTKGDMATCPDGCCVTWWAQDKVSGGDAIAKPPTSFIDRYGIPRADRDTVIEWNDGSDMTLPEIADAIEKGGLFT